MASQHLIQLQINFLAARLDFIIGKDRGVCCRTPWRSDIEREGKHLPVVVSSFAGQFSLLRLCCFGSYSN